MASIVDAVSAWAENNSIGYYTSVDVIRTVMLELGISDSEFSDDEIAWIRNSAIEAVYEKKRDAAKGAIKTLTDLMNRSDGTIVKEATLSAHPYLLNELIWTLLSAIKQKCMFCEGHWDGRIAISLREFIEQHVVE